MLRTIRIHMTHHASQTFSYTLNDVALFCGLNDLQLSDLKTHTIVKHYTKDSILFYEGEQSPYIQILLEGTVRLYKTTPAGKEIYLHKIEAPSVIAMGPALECMPFPASCDFVEDGVVGMLALEKFHMCLENLECTVAIIATMAKRLKRLEQTIHKETIFSSEAKVADLVSRNAGLFERLKNTEIASILNLTPETLSRILSKMKKQNIISIEHHAITVLDSKALQEVIDTNALEKSKTIKFPKCC